MAGPRMLALAPSLLSIPQSACTKIVQFLPFAMNATLVFLCNKAGEQLDLAEYFLHENMYHALN
jgi:hypothetical protein